MKFTKHHNRVARKNLLKVRKAKLTGNQGAATDKIVKRAVRQVEPKKASWSLSSLLQNVTAYFTGETTTKPTKKRPQRNHPKKKATKSATSAAAAATKPATTTTAAKK